jgi:pyrroline-5-carboxylate reductase
MEATQFLSIQTETYKLGFIGAGKMAESIAKGAVQSGFLPPPRISTSIHSNPARRLAFDSLGVKVLPQNRNVIRKNMFFI